MHNELVRKTEQHSELQQLPILLCIEMVKLFRNKSSNKTGVSAHVLHRNVHAVELLWYLTMMYGKL